MSEVIYLHGEKHKVYLSNEPRLVGDGDEMNLVVSNVQQNFSVMKFG